MFTISSTVTSFWSAAQGFASPSKIGPTAEALPSAFSVWYAPFAAPSDANTSVFATRVSRENP